MIVAATLASLIPFYLIGCFPSGHLVARRAGVDISNQGSGNVGATNVARVLGKRAGIIVLLCDLLKGFLGVLLASFVTDVVWFSSAAAVALVAGHCFSIPGKLKGGKGVATGLGVSLALAPFTALIALIVFLVFFYYKRIVSLASILAALSVPLSALLLDSADSVTTGLSLSSFLIVARHYANIDRLIKGTEPRYQSAKT